MVEKWGRAIIGLSNQPLSITWNLREYPLSKDLSDYLDKFKFSVCENHSSSSKKKIRKLNLNVRINEHNTIKPVLAQ